MSQEGDVQGGIVSTLNIRRSATAADDDHDDDDNCGDVTDMVTDRCFMLPLCLLRRGSDSPPPACLCCRNATDFAFDFVHYKDVCTATRFRYPPAHPYRFNIDHRRIEIYCSTLHVCHKFVKIELDLITLLQK